MTVTIGVDTSTTNCGVAIYKDGKLVGTKLLTYSGKYNFEKLRRIVVDFVHLFSDYSPDIVLIEEPAPVRASRAITGLNQVAGAVFCCALMHNAFVDMIHNRTVKRLMQTKTKEDAIRLASTLWTGEVSEHEADAVLVVEAYKKLIKSNE